MVEIKKDSPFFKYGINYDCDPIGMWMVSKNFKSDMKKICGVKNE